MKKEKNAPLSYREAEERKTIIMMRTALVMQAIAVIFSVVALIVRFVI